MHAEKFLVRIGALLLLVLSGLNAMMPHGVQAEPTPGATPPTLPNPPPPPTAPAIPDVSGTWIVSRYWYRRCPRCSEPVAQGTTWVITQVGSELRIDRGLRGTIEGYNIYLAGIESDGFNRYDFYYSRLYLTPDGLHITGEFVGSERIQNLCGYSPPIVTCFANAGYLHATRRSPLPAPPPSLPPQPSPTASPTLTQVPSPPPTATAALPPVTVTPSVTASALPVPTQPTTHSATARRRYLPLVMHPRQDLSPAQ